MITGSGDEHKEHKLQKRAEPQVSVIILKLKTRMEMQYYAYHMATKKVPSGALFSIQ